MQSGEHKLQIRISIVYLGKIHCVWACGLITLGCYILPETEFCNDGSFTACLEWFRCGNIQVHYLSAIEY
jgi:hypothetical protein